jgi:hypothetical protein
MKDAVGAFVSILRQSRILQRNLVILGLLAWASGGVVDNALGANTSTINLPCNDYETGTGYSARCISSATCNPITDAVLLVYGLIDQGTDCRYCNTYKEAHTLVGSGNDGLTGWSASTAGNYNLRVAYSYGWSYCSNGSHGYIKQLYPWNCLPNTPSGGGTGGPIAGGYPAGGCDYCQYHWESDAECQGPSDTVCPHYPVHETNQS